MRTRQILTWTTVILLMLAGVQPALGTKYIPSDSSIGTWDPGTRTYTLTTDVSEAIQIDEDNLTLDGAGYTVTGSGDGYGVDLSGRTWVTVKGLSVQGFSYGIYLWDASNNTLTGNTANSNTVIGIYLAVSADNTLTYNTVLSNNTYGIYLNNSSNSVLTDNWVNWNNGVGIMLDDSSYCTVTGNIANSNNGQGIYLHKHCNNNTMVGNTANMNSEQGIALSTSNSNTLAGNTFDSNILHGIGLNGCNSNTFTGNTAVNNHTGIILGSSSDNTLTDNTANSNTYYGIYIHFNSNNNTVTGNTASSNNDTGISISPYCNNNTLTGNTVSNNPRGIILWDSSDNQIYNNNFINNTQQASVAGEDSTGNVFNLDRPIGGNYWSDWTSPDADGDGIVDTPYVFTGGQDDLPWAEPDGWICKDPQDMIAELADLVLSLNLQHGISNSLDAKLDAVLQALDDINENNDVAAVNALGAFINAVVAQSGSRISQVDADALISRAQRIIDCLRGS